MKGVFFLLLLGFVTIEVKASNIDFIPANNSTFLELNQLLPQDSVTTILNDSVPKKVKFKRGKAILFTIFTGFLGGHRIYFGTHHRTPIIYSITLGGLGILPLIDLINIIFTKDLSKFENKSQIIMWGR